MPKGLTGKFRLRAALSCALAYAACILTPPAALALGQAAHCLTDEVAAHVHMAAQPVPHTHADDTTHDHAAHSHDQAAGGASHEHSGSDGKDHTGNCCGVFCLSAIADEWSVALPPPPAASCTLAAPDRARAGRVPDRLIRPPIG